MKKPKDKNNEIYKLIESDEFALLICKVVHSKKPIEKYTYTKTFAVHFNSTYDDVSLVYKCNGATVYDTDFRDYKLIKKSHLHLVDAYKKDKNVEIEWFNKGKWCIFNDDFIESYNRGLTYRIKPMDKITQEFYMKYTSGNYILVGEKWLGMSTWCKLDTIHALNNYTSYKLIHKKDEYILDAYLENKNVEIECKSVWSDWCNLEIDFIEFYDETNNYEYRLKQSNSDVTPKQLLETGMICETRTGELKVYLWDALISYDEGGASLNSFNDDLSYKHNERSDVMKIYKPTRDGAGAGVSHWIKNKCILKHCEVIWERPVEKELTKEQIEDILGYKIRIVDESSSK